MDYEVSYATWVLLLIDLWFTNATKSLPNVLMLIYSVEEQVEGIFSSGNDFSPHHSSRFSGSQSCASSTSCKVRNGMFFFQMCLFVFAQPPFVAPHVSSISQNLC